MKVTLPLIRNVLLLLAKNVLISLGLTVVASVTDAAINIHWSRITTLIIWNEERNERYNENSSILLKI